MLDYDGYYCKMFINKDVEYREVEMLIEKLISGKKNDISNSIASWGEIDVILNKVAKPPWGKVDDTNFLYWKFFLDIVPDEKVSRLAYINGIIDLIEGLRRNGYQVISACDFEDELPKYEEKL
jgi:hypothetical protein